MEPAAGRPGPNPDPTPAAPRRPAPARSPLVPSPTGKRIRSAPVVLPPREGCKPTLLAMDAPAPKRRFNRVGIALAIVVCLGTIPFTYRFQQDRLKKDAGPKKTDYNIPVEKRQWRMNGLYENTEKQAIARFGTPYISRNFSMSEGAFAGPAVGLKKFYPKTLPDYEARLKEAEMVWEAPHYSVIREVIWQLPDSYLTVWMREPRAEIDLGDKDSLVALPTAPEDSGDWVVIDNFRVGKDLVKSVPSPSPTPAP